MAILSGKWLGLTLFILGISIIVGEEWWYQTRTFVAYDESFSVHQGRVTTHPFSINFPDFYSIFAEGYSTVSASGKSCKDDSAIRYEWTLRKDGKVVRQANDADLPHQHFGNGIWLQGFIAEKGRYQLEIHFLSNRSCADSDETRLLIEIDPFEAYQDGQALIPIECCSLFFAVAGLIAFVGSKSRPFRTARTLPKFQPGVRSPAPAGPESAIAPAFEPPHMGAELLGWSPLQALRARNWRGFSTWPWERGSTAQFPVVVRNPATALPTVALVLVSFLVVFWSAWVVLMTLRQIPVGIVVHVMGPRTVVGSELAGETLAVWIDARNEWYFNSKPTTQEELPRLLRERSRSCGASMRG